MAATGAEKRKHYRFAMSYPVKLFDRAGKQLASSQTANLSRGGALVGVCQEACDKLGHTVNVTISLPEESYRVECATEFACQARVVRQEQLTDGLDTRVALEFATPMQLAN